MNKTLQKATTLINPNYKVILEFGVSVGTSTSFLRSTFPGEYKIYGFDSFYGLPEDWIDNGQKVADAGSFNNNGRVPNISGVNFVSGWFADTVPIFAKEHTEPVALIHIDCDIYSAAKTALVGINHLIVNDTILSFDDWCIKPQRDTPQESPKDIRCFCDGVQKAFHEWAMELDRSYEMLPIVGDEVYRRIVRIKE